MKSGDNLERTIPSIPDGHCPGFVAYDAKDPDSKDATTIPPTWAASPKLPHKVRAKASFRVPEDSHLDWGLRDDPAL